MGEVQGMEKRRRRGSSGKFVDGKIQEDGGAPQQVDFSNRIQGFAVASFIRWRRRKLLFLSLVLVIRGQVWLNKVRKQISRTLPTRRALTFRKIRFIRELISSVCLWILNLRTFGLPCSSRSCGAALIFGIGRC